jgi:hypothetical protein
MNIFTIEYMYVDHIYISKCVLKTILTIVMWLQHAPMQIWHALAKQLSTKWHMAKYKVFSVFYSIKTFFFPQYITYHMAT